MLSDALLLLLHRNRWDLIVFVPFLAFLILPGSFILLPVVVLRFPHLLPSVFQNGTMKVRARERKEPGEEL